MSKPLFGLRLNRVRQTGREDTWMEMEMEMEMEMKMKMKMKINITHSRLAGIWR